MECQKDGGPMMRAPHKDFFTDHSKQQCWECPQCGFTQWEIISEEEKLKEHMLTEPDEGLTDGDGELIKG